eukprot:scaffold224468_cov31-Tisochrysis_lutea.AAC.3
MEGMQWQGGAAAVAEEPLAELVDHRTPVRQGSIRTRLRSVREVAIHAVARITPGATAGQTFPTTPLGASRSGSLKRAPALAGSGDG